jgi:hypothetical protein
MKSTTDAPPPRPKPNVTQAQKECLTMNERLEYYLRSIIFLLAFIFVANICSWAVLMEAYIINRAEHTTPIPTYTKVATPRPTATPMPPKETKFMWYYVLYDSIVYYAEWETEGKIIPFGEMIWARNIGGNQCLMDNGKGYVLCSNLQSTPRTFITNKVTNVLDKQGNVLYTIPKGELVGILGSAMNDSLCRLGVLEERFVSCNDLDAI